MDIDLSSTQPIIDVTESSAVVESDFYISFNLPSKCFIQHVALGTTVIGRDLGCPITVNDESLSRRHASIELNENGLCFVTDLGSVNGTWRNRLRLKPNVAYEIRSQDCLKFGTVIATVHVTPIADDFQVRPTQCTQPDESTYPPAEVTVNGTKTASVDLLPAASDVSSAASSRVLSPILVDNEVLQNASQYVSRSPSPVWSGSQGHPLGSAQSLLNDIFICDTQPDCVSDDAVVQECKTTQPHQTVFNIDPATTALSNAVSPSNNPSMNVNAVFSPSVVNTNAAIASTPRASISFERVLPLALDSEPRVGMSRTCTLQLTECNSIDPECQHVNSTGSAFVIEESQVPFEMGQCPSLKKNGNSSNPLVAPVHTRMNSSTHISPTPWKLMATDNVFCMQAGSNVQSIGTDHESGCDSTQPMTFGRSVPSLNNSPKTPMTSQCIMHETEVTERTQPMAVLPLLRSTRFSATLLRSNVDLDDSQTSAERVTPMKNTSSPSIKPHQEHCISKTTPHPLTWDLTRQLQTTGQQYKRGRKASAAGRISEIHLSNAFGTVKFRSRTRSSLRTVDLNTSDDVNLEHGDIVELTGTPIGLVRPASHGFNDTKKNMIKSNHTCALTKTKSRTTGSSLFRIPSPVPLPDSLLSEEPSQLEDMLNNRIVSNQSLPENDTHTIETKSGDTKATVQNNVVRCLSPVLRGDSGQRLTDPSRKSALRAAGFEESPSESGRDTGVREESVVSVTDHNHRTTRNLADSQLVPNLPYVCMEKMPKHLAISHSPSTGLPESPPRKPRNRRRRTTAVVASRPTRCSRRLTTFVETVGSPEHSAIAIPPIQPPTASGLRAAKRRATRSHESSERSPSLTETTKSVPLLFSGVDANQFSSVLPSLDAYETGDVLNASCLITDGWKRTLKMLYARARGIPIVSVEWLLTCKRSRKPPFPALTRFLILPPVEKRPSAGRLSNGTSSGGAELTSFLHGWSIRCTPDVAPPTKDLAQLCQLAGGCWMSNEQLQHAIKQQPVQTVIITTPERLRSTVEPTKKSRSSLTGRTNLLLHSALASLPCVSVDWFLQAVMQRAPPQWPIPATFRLN